MEIKTLVDCARKLEQENLMVYEVYEQVTHHVGLKKLLRGIILDTKGHIKEIEDFLARPADPLDIFSSPPSLGSEFIDSCEAPLEFDALANNSVIFHLIIDRESHLVEIYDFLSGLSRTDIYKHFFRTLSEGEKRHITWARDRLDLESMLSS